MSDTIIVRGTAPTHVLGSHLELDYSDWSALWDLVVDVMYPDCSGADDCEQCDDRDFLAACSCRHIAADAQDVAAFLKAIEGRDRGALLVEHDTLTNKLVTRLVTFLRACGGFEYFDTEG